MMNIWKTLATKTLIDTGPIVALIIRRDRYHLWSVSVLDDISGILLTNPAVLTEAFHLLRKTDRGPSVLMQMIEERFIKVENPYPAHLRYIHQQYEKYFDSKASFADINLLAQYENNEEAPIFTIDSDFDIYKTVDGKTLNTIKPGF